SRTAPRGPAGAAPRAAAPGGTNPPRGGRQCPHRRPKAPCAPLRALFVPAAASRRRSTRRPHRPRLRAASSAPRPPVEKARPTKKASRRAPKRQSSRALPDRQGVPGPHLDLLVFAVVLDAVGTRRQEHLVVLELAAVKLV